MALVGQTALDHVSALAKSESLDSILLELSKAGKNFGYDNFCISGLPLPNEKIDPYVMLSGWPEAWLKRYLENDYVNHDPVISHTRISNMPFAWDESVHNKPSSKSITVLNEAKEFGLEEGLSVPIYTTHGFQAIVTFGAKKLRLNKEERSALHLIAIYAHSKARTFLPDSYNLLDRDVPVLSKREVECLKWSACGKTAWEVSVILCISQRTVEQFLKSAANKLNATNRTQAVAEAMRRHIIQ